MEHTYGIGQDCEYVARRRRCAILRDLTEPDRVLLEWRMVDGWDYATIALRLGVPRADLVKRVHRPSPEGKNALTGRHPVQPGGDNARLKYLSFGTRIRYVYNGNGAGKLRPDSRHIGGNLAPPYVHSFQWDMDTEQSEAFDGRPAASRSEAMRKAWEKRRATAALEKESLAHPECSCGCRARLEVAKNQEHQRYFKPGHDSALKSLLRKINRGEAKREDIPQAARANVARIKFIQADPEFQKAFAKPGQPQRRQPAKGETA